MKKGWKRLLRMWNRAVKGEVICDPWLKYGLAAPIIHGPSPEPSSIQKRSRGQLESISSNLCPPLRTGMSEGCSFFLYLGTQRALFSFRCRSGHNLCDSTASRSKFLTHTRAAELGPSLDNFSHNFQQFSSEQKEKNGRILQLPWDTEEQTKSMHKAESQSLR